MPVAIPDLAQTEAVIIERTNVLRGDNNLAPVVQNPALQIAARAFAAYLAETGSFSHTADGHQPAERAAAAGYRFCIVAENIAAHQSNQGFETSELADRAMQGWENSPIHRANLLQPDVTETGIGIAKMSRGEPRFVTVQLFGRPDSLRYSFAIENRSGAAVNYTLGNRRQSVASAVSIRHTECLPREITFDAGKVTAKFTARDGATFLITRGSDGLARVAMQSAPVVVQAQSTPRAHAAKAVKVSDPQRREPGR